MPAQKSSPVRTSQVTVVAVLLGLTLFLAYLLTFSGAPKTDDERFIIDTTDSIAVRGNLLLNETSYLSLIRTSDVEPGQPLLSAPLYWLAYHIPWVGNVHALYLFTPLVTAMTGVLLFLFILDLGYGQKTALIATLLFGLTTFVWPYTQTYFREPLTMLNLFAAAFFIQRWRQAFQAKSRAQWPYLAAAVLVTLLAVLSKEVILIALPMLLLLAYPGSSDDPERRKQLRYILLALVIIAVIVALFLTVFAVRWEAIASRYKLLERFDTFMQGLPFIGQGLAGYFISPGRAIWWFSPVTLLALAAPFITPRKNWRETWLWLGFTLWFALIYAAIRGELWFGGTGWGPRYMLPLIPFLMLAALPALDRILNSSKVWPKLLLGFLALCGLTAQITGTYVSMADYDGHLIASTGLMPWQVFWNIRWSQVVGGFFYMGQAAPDILWLIPSPDWLTIATILLGVALCAAALIWLTRRDALSRPTAIAFFAAPLVIGILLAGFSLSRAYDDPRYMGGDESLTAMLAYLSENAGPDDVIMLSSTKYVPHFMNYYKGEAAWYSMNTPPGEQPSPEQPSEIVSDEVEVLAGEQAQQLISRFLRTGTFYEGQPIWLVGELGPWLEWAVRPAEWYLAKYSYFVTAADFGSHGHVAKFLPMRAPAADETPTSTLDATFGSALHLLGADLVDKDEHTDFESIAAGSHVGISLLWEATARVEVDYTFSVHLISPEGVSIMQQDHAPVAGFEPTSGWKPGERLRDNYGFELPEDALSGQYQFWLMIYSWPSLELLPITGPDGQPAGDHLVLGTFEVP